MLHPQVERNGTNGTISCCATSLCNRGNGRDDGQSLPKPESPTKPAVQGGVICYAGGVAGAWQLHSGLSSF